MGARTFRLGNSLESIAELIAFVEAFAEEEGVPMAAAMHLQLAIEEAATNVVRHGFGAGGGEATVLLSREGDCVKVEIVDDAPAFDPLSVAAPDIDAPLHERELGGLGIEMIRKMTDRQEYRREDGRNRLLLVKTLAE